MTSALKNSYYWVKWSTTKKICLIPQPHHELWFLTIVDSEHEPKMCWNYFYKNSHNFSAIWATNLKFGIPAWNSFSMIFFFNKIGDGHTGRFMNFGWVGMEWPLRDYFEWKHLYWRNKNKCLLLQFANTTLYNGMDSKFCKNQK